MLMDMAPGAIVDGRYRLLNRLGAGGMAEVWAATDRELGREVALKLLYPRLAADKDFVERFRREASAAAGLQHPNVVQVYDRGESQGTYYIAMEYLRGPSLKDLVRNGPLSPAHAVELVIEVLKGARFAHRRGIVHRDLKPHNVMLDEEGRVKVTDFGIARAGASDMTETGSIMGTAQYLSPEQAQGHAVTERSDLYSIGVILFELLTGQVPFDGESAVTVALRHVSEPAPAPSQFAAAVPPALDAVALRALAKEPEERFANADEFIAALEQAMANPDQAGATRMAAAYPVGAGDDPGDEEDRRSRGWMWWLAGLLVVAALALGAYYWLQADLVTVPDVVGREAGVATRMLERRGFDVEARNVASDDVDPGRVAAQAPPRGQEVFEGSVVTISISTGPAEVEIPDVSGMSREAAEETLEDAGFTTSVSRESSGAVPEGNVIRTDPPAGRSAARGSEVTLVVSTGPAAVTVPDVTAMDRDEATQALTQAGFAVAVSERETDAEEPGEVLEQSPGAGARIAPGSEVRIVVAEELPPVDVPDVLGLSYDDAVEELEEAGLRARRRVVEVPTQGDDGLVVAQNPAAGEEAEPGSVVRLDVGRYSPPGPDPGLGPDPDDDDEEPDAEVDEVAEEELREETG